jgi:hypothetical protein
MVMDRIYALEDLEGFFMVWTWRDAVYEYE